MYVEWTISHKIKIGTHSSDKFLIKLIYLNFQPLDVLSCYRDLHRQVVENYSCLFQLQHPVCYTLFTIIIFGLCPNISILQRNFKTDYSWHVFVRRYSSFLSNQLESLTQHSQSQEVCYDF